MTAEGAELARAGRVSVAVEELERLREAARELVDAEEAVRDAVNGQGHPDEPHDRALHVDPCTGEPGLHVYSTSTDCAACGGAEYGADYRRAQALGAVRELLGLERRPWESEG